MNDDSVDKAKSDSALSTTDAVSSADHVNKHLQQIESRNADNPQRPLSPEEQLFTEDELVRLINPNKLQILMNNGDDLVNYLTSEIDKFED